MIERIGPFADCYLEPVVLLEILDCPSGRPFRQPRVACQGRYHWPAPPLVIGIVGESNPDDLRILVELRVSLEEGI